MTPTTPPRDARTAEAEREVLELAVAYGAEALEEARKDRDRPAYTLGENTADRDHKGRQARGDRHGKRIAATKKAAA